MPELRRDPVVGYWTIVSTERGRRPVEFQRKKITDERPCPFCEGKETDTPSEVFAVRKPGSPANGAGWEVRVILSKMPLLVETEEAGRSGRGLYDLMHGVGKHEIIIEHPQHKRDLDEMIVPHVEKVVQAYVQRIRELEKDARFKYALLFKNHGLISGSERDVIQHSRSQIIAMPIIPKRVKEELASTRSYFERRERCVFCDVLRQEAEERSRIVAENASFLAFCPYASRAPFEVWVLPKAHCADFGKLPPEHVGDFARILKECLARIGALLNDPPFNFILHTAPYQRRKKEGYWSTIEEDYHWYWQIAPRLTGQAGFEWGTGIHINPTPPEEAAFLLRETSVNA